MSPFTEPSFPRAGKPKRIRKKGQRGDHHKAAPSHNSLPAASQFGHNSTAEYEPSEPGDWATSSFQDQMPNGAPHQGAGNEDSQHRPASQPQAPGLDSEGKDPAPSYASLTASHSDLHQDSSDKSSKRSKKKKKPYQKENDSSNHLTGNHLSGNHLALESSVAAHELAPVTPRMGTPRLANLATPRLPRREQEHEHEHEHEHANSESTPLIHAIDAFLPPTGVAEVNATEAHIVHVEEVPRYHNGHVDEIHHYHNDSISRANHVFEAPWSTLETASARDGKGPKVTATVQVPEVLEAPALEVPAEPAVRVLDTQRPSTRLHIGEFDGYDVSEYLKTLDLELDHGLVSTDRRVGIFITFTARPLRPLVQALSAGQTWESFKRKLQQRFAADDTTRPGFAVEGLSKLHLERPTTPVDVYDWLYKHRSLTQTLIGEDYWVSIQYTRALVDAMPSDLLLQIGFTTFEEFYVMEYGTLWDKLHQAVEPRFLLASRRNSAPEKQLAQSPSHHGNQSEVTSRLTELCLNVVDLARAVGSIDDRLQVVEARLP
ncbi:unnamed protein product [Clonostachys rhizophaga]|uniref:Uncharacterized protein n=1 Tax=Clonostachys rhizophaga TaxID=160324 RepID=A0A9N9VB12_9HYPO|nr:unnamed protein product [Clonostachys rhizophaga]